MAITLNTHGNAHTNAGSQVTLALTGAKVGDLIVAEFFFGASQGNSFTSVTDNLNGPNTPYTVAIAPHLNGGYVGIAYFQNSTNGNPTLSLNLSALPSFMSLSAQIFTGAAPSNALDSAFTQQQDGSTSNPTTGTSKTPKGNGEVVIGLLLSATNTPTNGTNFTTIDQDVTIIMSPEYWIQTTATATNAPFVMAADTWTDQMVAFSPLPMPEEDFWDVKGPQRVETTIPVFG